MAFIFGFEENVASGFDQVVRGACSCQRRIYNVLGNCGRVHVRALAHYAAVGEYKFIIVPYVISGNYVWAAMGQMA